MLLWIYNVLKPMCLLKENHTSQNREQNSWLTKKMKLIDWPIRRYNYTDCSQTAAVLNPIITGNFINLSNHSRDVWCNKIWLHLYGSHSLWNLFLFSLSKSIYETWWWEVKFILQLTCWYYDTQGVIVSPFSKSRINVP